jgi:Electron transfer DM13
MASSDVRAPRAERGSGGGRRRSGLLVAAALVAAVVLGVAAYLFQPWRVFTSTTVNEALPGVTATAPAAGSGAQAPTPSASSPSVAGPATSSAAAAAPRPLSRGSFISQAHDTSGTATVLQLPDGSKVLRLEGLSTSDGPDVKVWLTDAPATRDGGSAVDRGAYLSLGDLKGNKGNQNYPIPANADLKTLRTVSVWCDRFNVSFGAAALTAV